MKYSLDKINGDMGGMKSKIDRHESLINVLVIVLFVGFAGVFVAANAMLVDAFNSKQATCQDLVNKVSEQNIKNDLILKELEDVNLKYGKFTCKYEKNGISCQP